MAPGFWQIVVIALIAMLFFGRGRISELMGDVAKGIKSFKKGLADEDNNDNLRQDDVKKITHDNVSQSNSKQNDCCSEDKKS